MMAFCITLGGGCLLILVLAAALARLEAQRLADWILGPASSDEEQRERFTQQVAVSLEDPCGPHYWNWN